MAAIGLKGKTNRPFVLFSVLAFSCILLYGVQHALAVFYPEDPEVDPHILFETLLRAVVSGGESIVRGQNDSARTTLNSKFSDGTNDAHLLEDTVSAAYFDGLSKSVPGLSVVEEEAVAQTMSMRAGVASGGRPVTLYVTRPSRRKGRGRVRAVEKGLSAALQRETLPVPELAVYIDPLDGSTDFASETEKGENAVSVSACITRCGTPIAAVTYLPFEKRIYWTSPGAGLHVNFDVDTAIQAQRGVGASWDMGARGEPVSGPLCCAGGVAGTRHAEVKGWADDLEVQQAVTAGLKIVVSRSHSTSSAAERVLAAVRHMTQLVHLADKPELPSGPAAEPDVLPMGGAGRKAIEVIEKRAHAYLHAGSIRKWDTCAAEAMVRAGGGEWTDWHGKGVDYCVRPSVRRPGPGEEAHTSDAMNAAFSVDGVLSAWLPSIHAGMLAGAKAAEDASSLP